MDNKLKVFRSIGYLILLTAITIVLPAMSLRAATRYIEITRGVVNIRTNPSTSGQLVVKAKRGDILELIGEENGWYKIRLFSGKPRFVHKNLAKHASYTLQVPLDTELRRSVYQGWFKTEQRAEREANRKYPPDRDLKNNLDYLQLLSDRYKLEMMQRLGVQAPIYRRIILEGNRKRWGDQ